MNILINMEKEKFDYAAAVAELEELVCKVENPGTAVDDIEKYIDKAEALVKECRAYLRSAHEKLESLDNLG